jgi:hypothetical protein
MSLKPTERIGLVSKRSKRRLHLSSHANTPSMGKRSLYTPASRNLCARVSAATDCVDSL